MGKVVADYCNLPLWMDSFGTVLSAYIFGPICGAIVGATVNIIYGMFDTVSLIYAITNILIGIIIGVAAKHKVFETIFTTISTSVLLTIVSFIVSATFNMIFYDGMTGNVWGDGVINYLQEMKVSHILCVAAGEFYIEIGRAHV